MVVHRSLSSVGNVVVLMVVVLVLVFGVVVVIDPVVVVVVGMMIVVVVTVPVMNDQCCEANNWTKQFFRMNRMTMVDCAKYRCGAF